MSKKLNIQAVNAAHQAAADAVTKANEVRNALRSRLRRDWALAAALCRLTQVILDSMEGHTHDLDVDAEFRDQLEPTANSYGYTLTDHPTRRDLVVVQPLEN